ncbi:transketolase [Cephaloticoccus primus]|uniref:Transketolase n=1 Tax=Cephaloticoccus primus TaxID=1548207 RepID=A0A139SQS0_9BACT|nr:alpha-ketoacid dehydrogenase subunit alpha/beta [Cephaloticoccus primus]KXU36854.1 transketolase [Cephaloticoccus primus]
MLPTTPKRLEARDLRLEDLENRRTETLLQLYAWMYLARATDNRILELFRQGLIKGTVTGGQGNEGLIVPLTLLADKARDVVSFTHRDLGGHLIWSGHLCEHLNQYFANAQSPTKAREGNVHHGDPANRSLPMISHLGTMISNVLGATDAQRRAGQPAVGFAFFGDGSSSTGDVHESLNLASLLGLPVVFVIENNRYAYSTPTEEQYAAGVELWQRAAGYGMEGFAVDATEPEGFSKALGTAIDKVRTTSRPILVEAHTLRLRGHAAYDTCDYLKPGENDAFHAQDPLPRFRAKLCGELGDEAELRAIEAELDAYLEACVKHSLAIPRPKAGDMLAEVFAPTPRAPAEQIAWAPTPAEPQPLNFAQAITAAHRKILSERPESLVLGQDIGRYGGAFKVTEGLLEEFGRARVFNTPLAESACTGYAIGLALRGYRPIEEFQFADFATEAVTQITQNAATLFFRGGAACPLVLRLPCGSVQLGSFHSQELESAFLSFPGLKALYPSTPQDAFDALLAAYEDNNPVLLFENKALYRCPKEPVAWNPDFRKIWEPKQVRTGEAATLVSYGEALRRTEAVCDYLADEYDIALDLFDLRALSPLRLDTIEASLRRTGRLAIIHEGRRNHGFGAELLARLTEAHFAQLKAAPLRIASLDLPVPFAGELEHVYRPQQDAVIERLLQWIG